MMALLGLRNRKVVRSAAPGNKHGLLILARQVEGASGRGREHGMHGGQRNERAFDHARDLIAVGKYVIDDRDAWSEHQPSARQENDYIERHGIAEYARWHLGIDDEADENRKGRYKFPYGDFQDVHRCGLLAAESRSGQRKYYDIELAVAHLHGMLEALRMSAVTPDRS